MKGLTLTQKEQARLQVLNGILEGQISVDETAEVLGVSERHVWRILAEYRKEGAAALAHGNRGRRANNSIPEEARTQVVALARTRYARVNHTHLTELLAEREEIVLGRLTVEDFASKLSDFFMRQWQAAQMPPDGPPMVFLVGGYDEGAPYGRVFECFVPTAPQPKEQHPGSDQFGMVWGGQREFTDRIITGFDGQLPGIVQDILALDDHQRDNLNQSQGEMRI